MTVAAALVAAVAQVHLQRVQLVPMQRGEARGSGRRGQGVQSSGDHSGL